MGDCLSLSFPFVSPATVFGIEEYSLTIIDFDIFYLLVQCSSIDSPASGSAVFDSDGYTTLVTFSCIAGYELYGNSVLSCLHDGTWNGTQPSCGESHSDEIYPHKTNVFLGILESACLSVRVSICIQNITFCQSAGRCIKSHSVTSPVIFCVME